MITSIDQPSQAEWWAVTNRTLSRSSNRHSRARSSGTSRALRVSLRCASSWMTASRAAPAAAGTSWTSSGTGHGPSTC
jgi:hypothetical protein